MTVIEKIEKLKDEAFVSYAMAAGANETCECHHLAARLNTLSEVLDILRAEQAEKPADAQRDAAKFAAIDAATTAEGEMG